LIGDSKKTAFVVVNDWKASKGPMHVYEDRAHLVHALLTHLRDGKRCFVCANSKKTVHRLTRLIREEFGDVKKLTSITSENSQTKEAQDFLLGLPNTCLEYDCVLVSPAVGTGVDITFPHGESKVDAVFGFFVSLVNTHFDVDQQICRVRHPGAVHVWVDQQKLSFCTDQRVIETDLLSTANWNFLKIGYEEDGTPKYSDADKIYATIFSEVTALRRASKNNFLENFSNLRKQNGWDVITVPKDETASKWGQELLATASELEEDARIERLLVIPATSSSDYSTLVKRSKRGSLSPDDTAKMRRYEIERFYLLPISRELIEEDEDGNLRDAVRTFELLVGSDDDLDNWWLRLESLARPNRVLAIDVNEARTKKRLLESLFMSAGVYAIGQGFKCDVIITKDSLTDFVETCREERERIERLLDTSLRQDLRTKPTSQLSTFLRHVGLSLQHHDAKKEGNSKVYRYHVDAGRLAKVDTVVQRRKSQSCMGEWNELQRRRFPGEAAETAATAQAAIPSENESVLEEVDLDAIDAELDAKSELYARIPDLAPVEPDF
jgi:hypothetical protein